MRQWFYLREDEAKDYGMTHRGTLFGLPCYFLDVDNDEEFGAIPVVPLLVPYLWVMDALFGVFSSLVPQDVEVPVELKKKL